MIEPVIHRVEFEMHDGSVCLAVKPFCPCAVTRYGLTREGESRLAWRIDHPKIYAAHWFVGVDAPEWVIAGVKQHEATLGHSGLYRSMREEPISLPS